MRIESEITRTEMHRDGNGKIIGLDCYEGGPGSGETLVGLALPKDSRGDGTVLIDGRLYALPFGVMERLQGIADDNA